MPPLSISSTKNPDWMRGPGYSFPPAGPLLDELDVQPLWAHSLGTQLRTGQTNVFRVRRDDDDEELDITVADLPTLPSVLAAFCTTNTGFLVKAYNAVAASPYPELTATSPADQAIIYDADGGAVLGANGLLAARFDSSGYATPFALVGDVSATLLYDVNPENADNAYAGIVGAGVAANPDTYGQWQSDAYYQAAAADSVTGVFYQQANLAAPDGFACNADTGGFVKAPSWIQMARAAGARIDQSTKRCNGLPLTITSPYGDQSVVPSFVADLLLWGYPTYGNFSVLQSNMFFWGAVLGAGDQAAVDAWELANHA